MPSKRKRIGFLPSKEVHEIIEMICSESNFSQSKVTGLLVKEALINRGFLKDFLNENEDFPNISNHLNKNNMLDLNNDLTNNINSPKVYPQDKKVELNMINDFIEYKFFKSIMIQNKNIFD